MAVDDATRADLADALYEAHTTGTPIDRVTAEHDLTIEGAYDVQSRFVERRLAEGASVVGHKVGLTSEGIQDQLGVSEPDFGRLLDTMFVADRTIPSEDLIAPRIEPEIGFLIAGELSPPVTYLDVLRATEAVVPVFEVIDSRIRDWDIRIEDTVADNASAGLYVTGERLHDPADVDLALEGVRVTHNGTVAAHGVGGAVLGHPARAVAWLANTLGEMDVSLAPGHLVLSGSFIPAVDVAAGDTVTAEFATLGTLTVAVGDA